jgi:hypothetical protein
MSHYNFGNVTVFRDSRVKPIGVAFGLLALGPVLFAGLYDPVPLASSAPGMAFLPNEKSPFRVENGLATPLDFGTKNDGEFAARFAVMTNLLDANPKRTNNPDRQAVLKATDLGMSQKDVKRPAEAATLAANLIRLGQPDRAINLLQPLSRGRSASYAVLMNLAHAHAAKMDWESALRTHDVALEYDPKDDLKALTPEQVQWLSAVEKKYYRTWLSWNLKNPKANPETDGPPPIFGPVKWVNDAGVFEPGTLAAAERAKLPTDALAIVQQLLLWQPTDTGLYWLLAELYAAEGKLRQADVIFDQCAWSRQFSNRKVLMAHREAVNAAVAKLPPESPAGEIDLGSAEKSPAEPGDDGLPSKEKVIIVLAVFVPLVILLIVFQVRAFVRRSKARRLGY